MRGKAWNERETIRDKSYFSLLLIFIPALRANPSLLNVNAYISGIFGPGGGFGHAFSGGKNGYLLLFYR